MSELTSRFIMPWVRSALVLFVFFHAPSQVFARTLATDTLVANSNFVKGSGFLKMQKYDSALKYFNIALPEYEKNESDLRVAICLGRIASIQFSISDYEGAEQTAERLINFASEKLSPNHIEVGHAHMILGDVHVYYRSDQNSAIAEYNRAIKVFRTINGENHGEVAKAYIDIGRTYTFFNGEIDLMIEYFLKALRVLLAVRDKNHPDLASVYNHLGVAYNDLGDFENAEYYLKKALAIIEMNGGEKNIQLANCLGNIGRIYKARGDYKIALRYFERVKRIHKEVFNDRNPFVIIAYRNIGTIYAELDMVNEARENYLKGIAIAQKLFGPKHSVIAALYNDLGDLSLGQHNYDLVLEYSQKSLTANLFDFNESDPRKNPAADSYHCESREFGFALSNKQKAYLKLFLEHKDLKDGLSALNTLELNERVIGQLGRDYQEQGDKVRFGNRSSIMYETGIEICLSLFEHSKDRKFLEKAFYYSEKSKAGILQGAVADVKAKNAGVIPVKLVELERSLREEKSKYQSGIQGEKQKGDHADEKKVVGISDKLFDVNRRHDSLISVLEKNYPKYFQLKYEQTIFSVGEVQQSLEDNTALIEYFAGRRINYAFIITNKEFNYVRIDSMQLIQNLIQNIRYSLDPRRTAEEKKKSITSYLHDGNLLYDFVIKATLPYTRGKDRLVIVPDGQLSYLPFEALLSAKVNTPNPKMNNLPYLLKEFKITYAYSATLLFQNMRTQKQSYKGELIAFAPEYNFTDKDSLLVADVNVRGRLNSLSWNREEVSEIGKLMGGNHFVGTDAQEGVFKKESPHYRIVHLAMHALIDDQHPQFSKLAFSRAADKTEDGFLNAYELYNMDLPAELVVLSACETGYGKMERGEGIMSLAHAFTFAGCPSIVMSHWVADDKATAELMELFYQNLAKGFSKDEALQKAKLNYMEGADEFRQNPAFWSGFVLIGDYQPLERKSFQENYWAYAAGFIVLMGLAVFMVVKTKRTQSATV